MIKHTKNFNISIFIYCDINCYISVVTKGRSLLYNIKQNSNLLINFTYKNICFISYNILLIILITSKMIILIIIKLTLKNKNNSLVLV